MGRLPQGIIRPWGEEKEDMNYKRKDRFSMFKKFGLLFCGLLISGSLLSQTTVRGTVYNDLNKNGKKDRREEGIPEVAVTNGVEVVLTDHRGRYELPLSNDQIISLIKPTGYSVPVNEDFLPQFFYIHKPDGSPESEFPGVAPTGDLPKSVDFALIEAPENEEFSVVLFGDPQPYNLQEIDYFARAIVADLKTRSKEVPFGLSLGDLVGDDLDLFNPYIKAIKEAQIPWYNLLGNHDLNFDATQDHLSDETYEAHFGPANYAFNYGKVHFIILDDVLYPDPRDGKGYWGGFREDQLQFIENNLQTVPKDYLIVLAFHIPWSEPSGDPFRDADRERVFKALKDFPHTLSLSAHTHLQRQDFLGADQGWQQEEPHHHYNVGTTSGDWYSGILDENNLPAATMRDGTPQGYAYLNFHGNQYTIDYQVIGESPDYRMEIFMPKVVAHGRNTSAGIYVNYFLGGEKDKVSYRVNDGEWRNMRKVGEYDPNYMKEVFEWDLAESLRPGRRGSNPVRSTHLWRGSIPARISPGVHTVEVKVEDMFGRTFTQTRTYRLEKPVAVGEPMKN